jgi:hypothetical protein
MDHGLITGTASVYHYGDMERIGTLSIGVGKDGGTHVRVEGFAFKDTKSCREGATKAMKWARDILTAKISAAELTPGDITSSVD